MRNGAPFRHWELPEAIARVGEQLQRRYRMVKEVLDLGIRDGSIRPDINPDLTAVVITQLGTANMLQRIFPTLEKLKEVPQYSTAELTENLIELIAVSLKNNP